MLRHSHEWLLVAAALLLGWSGSAAAERELNGLRFSAVLSGAQEVPAVTTESGARARVSFNRALSRALVHIDLRGPLQVVAAHFHCGRAGANGPVAFGILNPGPLLEVTDPTRVFLRNSDFAGSDCTDTVGRPVNNIAALALAMRDGLIYLNLHTPTVPSGEVRGQMLEVGDR